jgi:hypothetical protein
VGARRLADAAVWLGAVGETRAATVADQQARLLGSVQYSLVTGDAGTAAATLRQMRPPVTGSAPSPHQAQHLVSAGQELWHQPPPQDSAPACHEHSHDHR